MDYVDVEHRMQGKTLRKNMIGEKMRLDNLGEELRILYVALTRAKEKLIMTGMVEKPEKRLAMLLSTAERGDGQLAYGELAGAGNYLDFLLPALSVHRAFEPLWQACGLEAPENVRKKAETAAGKSAVGEETSGKSIVGKPRTVRKWQGDSGKKVGMRCIVLS
ncbi:ATP-dependent helicase/nuclease subunit A [Muribaculaceae bacterium]|nr:ATP-dependent helicase/nuclease subunit A [Muribaculaceae bacterium]